jgi:hypothetical protein
MLQCPTHPPAAATRCWRAGRSADRDLGNRSPLQGWAHAEIPPREAAAVRPDGSPVVRFRVIRRSLRAVAVTTDVLRDPSEPPEPIRLVPPGVSAWYLYFSDWNAFAYCCAVDGAFEWTEQRGDR